MRGALAETFTVRKPAKLAAALGVFAFATGSLFGLPSADGAVIYNGNLATGFGGGGLLGNGSLSISDNGAGNVTFTLNPNGTFNSNDVVVYINSIPGGFSDTSTFSDNNDFGRTAVSGANNGNPSRTLATFPTGFGADYALEFENNAFIGLFGLASGGNNSLNFVTGVTPTSGGPYTITFPLSDLGLSQGGSFNFDASLISTTAFRSNETIGNSTTVPDNGGDSPNAGFNGSTTFSSFDTYTSTPVPEPAAMGLVGAVALLALRRQKRA